MANPVDSSSTSPRCPSHRQAAVATCARCGTFLCGDCVELLGEAAWCADCVALLQRGGPSSRAVWVALGLGLTGVLSSPLFFLLWWSATRFLGFMPWMVWLLVAAPWLNVLVLVLGPWWPLRELRRIQRGEASHRGRALAWWALGLVLANLALALYWFSTEHFFWAALPA